MKLYQKAGIYRFGSDSSATIDIGAGSFLIGDGVTLVFDPNFPNFVGDGCKDTDPNEPHSSSTDPWKYYDVPAPALFAAPSPTTDFRLSGSLGAAMGQAVFGYFKKAAKLGTQLYDQDLNQNNVMDGVEYDRSLPGGILSGPDGVISSADAQKAFSQFKANIKCASGPAYRLNDSTTSN